jgi:hypothetical protein
MSERERDVDDLGEWLRERRPQLTPEAFDRVHDRVLSRGPGRRAPARASVLTAVCLALGLLLAGGGTGLAISGLASDTTAVSAQYGGTTTSATPPVTGSAIPGGTTNNISGASGSPTTTTTGTSETNPVLGGASEGNPSTVTAEAVQQVQAAGGGNSLPFTGFAAIPIVLAGALLIAIGAVLRRRAARAD